VTSARSNPDCSFNKESITDSGIKGRRAIVCVARQAMAGENVNRVTTLLQTAAELRGGFNGQNLLIDGGASPETF
jgi:hypothetical protein